MLLIEGDGDKVSRHTIGPRLRQEGIKCLRSCKKKIICDINRVKRRRYATGKVRRTRQDLGKVIFSDESPFPIERHDGRLWCYRRAGEWLVSTCVPTVRDKRTVHVWEAKSLNRRLCAAGTNVRKHE